MGQSMKLFIDVIIPAFTLIVLVFALVESYQFNDQQNSTTNNIEPKFERKN